MALIADYLYDLALAELDTEGDRLDICSQEPTTYAEATSTYTLGNKTSLSIGAPADGSPSGRKVDVAAITDGSVTSTGTATHWAIVDVSNTRLLATGPVAVNQVVTSGNTFTMGTFPITILDAT